MYDIHVPLDCFVLAPAGCVYQRLVMVRVHVFRVNIYVAKTRKKEETKLVFPVLRTVDSPIGTGGLQFWLWVRTQHKLTVVHDL